MVQTGSGVYGGVTAGSSLTGSVRYGVSAGDAAWVDINPVEQEWGFVGPEYGASYNVDGVVLGASDSKLSINNDLALSQAYVDVLTAAGISAVVGQTVDYWGLPVDSDSLHPDPADPTGPYVGGQEWGLVLLDLDGTMLSNTNFIADPSGLTGIDYAFLTVWDTADDGTILFEGVGLIGSLTPTAVPLPATTWLFGSGLIGLAGFGRRGRKIKM